MTLNIRNILRKRKLRALQKKEDWNRARVFVKFLKMFYDVTLKFSGSLHVTSNIFFKELVVMQRTLQKRANGGRMNENFSKY